ncbi:hypothetical protein BIW59_25820 [Salmonella enterica]|nr:hypothetical protein [Salmonella enterica]
MNKDNLLHKVEATLKNEDDLEDRIVFINKVRTILHQYSPFNYHPVDCVVWIHTDNIKSNNYNPNHMAPVEKRLLRYSIENEGFTQPIIASPVDDHYIVVDGFHRFQIIKKNNTIKNNTNGYVPVVVVNQKSQGIGERIAATIRHNRARGKHQISSMSDIVKDLTLLGWSMEKISTELGMDEDEVLRLKQISGLVDLFSGEAFNNAWTVV